MGSKGDFDKIWRAVAPLREFDAVDAKIKLRADPASPPDACSHE